MAFREFDSPNLSRRDLLSGSAMLAAGGALGGFALGPAAWAAAPAADWPHVSTFVNGYVEQGKVANMVAALGWGQQDPVVLAKGTASMGAGARAGIDTLYRVYSMTKPITGMAAMMLIDDGKLGLDQPLAEVLPAFAKMRVQKTYDGSITDLVPAERPITIRHVLTHTAGFGYSIMQKGPIKDAYEAAGLVPMQVSQIPIPGITDAPPARSLAAFADGLARMPLVYQPGTRWSYSIALDLMGRVIEVTSGQSLDRFLAESIFKPAGMDSTWFTVPPSERPRMTSNYAVLGGVLLPIDPAGASIYYGKPAFPFGGSGLVSSARDYDRFLRMLAGYGKIEGKRVLSEAAVRVGTSNLLPEGAITKGSFIEGAGFGAGGRVGAGKSAGTFGWGGAAGSIAFVDMRRGLRATLMTQYMPDSSYPVHSEFPIAVAADLKEKVAA